MKPVLFDHNRYRLGPDHALVAKLIALDQPKTLSHLYRGAFEAIEFYQNYVLEEENYDNFVR